MTDGMVGLAAHLEAGPNGGDNMPKMQIYILISLARAHTAIALLLLLRLSTHEHTYYSSIRSLVDGAEDARHDDADKDAG